MITALTALAAAAFTCRPQAVWDGDSFTCSSGTKDLEGNAAK